MNNPLNNVLYIDLTKRKYWKVDREDIFSKYLGGTGAAIQLLKEECAEGIDALDPDNVIVFAVGPLTGQFPLASKTVAMFKSPLTGNLGESHCGGRTAVAIRLAGYGAIVIKGKSEIPVYISVNGGSVQFRDATSIWGMNHSITAGKIIRQNEKNAGMRTIMRIGRAGENQVAYACVTAETYRHFGRLGLGAVFGSKYLKALVVSGTNSINVTDKISYRKLYSEIYDMAVTSSAMKKYHDLGTAVNVTPLNAFGGLPIENLTRSTSDKIELISGEALAEHYLGRRLACSHCPVGCIHIAALRTSYENEPFFYKTSMVSYDYEPIFSIGTMLGIYNPKVLLEVMDWVETIGVDVMSIGVVLAWATEAFQKQLITETITGGVRFAWGDGDSYIEAIKGVGEKRNLFFADLGKGAAYAARKYGGEDFALTFGGNEMAGYHTGPAAHLGFTLGLRHSHLDNGGYGIDQKDVYDKRLAPEAVIDTLVEEERWRQILSSLVVCFFARGIYKPEIVLPALKLSGYEIDKAALDKIAADIYEEKLGFKKREGYDPSKVRFPERIFQTPAHNEIIDRDFMSKAVAYYSSLGIEK